MSLHSSVSTAHVVYAERRHATHIEGQAPSVVSRLKGTYEPNIPCQEVELKGCVQKNCVEGGTRNWSKTNNRDEPTYRQSGQEIRAKQKPMPTDIQCVGNSRGGKNACNAS